MTNCPKLDFNGSFSEYVDTLGNFFVEIYRISRTKLASDHLKIHMRIPQRIEF
jgi:hypothetical protein